MYVDLLDSLSSPDGRYAGKSPHASKSRPWRIAVAVRFADDLKADAFERYLKSGSGHAFARRHFR